MKKYILSAFAVLGAFVSCKLEEPSVDFDDDNEEIYEKINFMLEMHEAEHSDN